MEHDERTDKDISLHEQKGPPPFNVTVEHIGIICRHWCRKNKIELTWIVFEGLSGEKCCLFEQILRKYEFLCTKAEDEISNYNDYRDYIILVLKEFIKRGFLEFNQLLIRGDNKTWGLLDQTMRKYAWIWSKNKGINFNEDMNSVYFSALGTMYEKLSSKKMIFTNSYELKSYFFRIFENKAMENHRMNMKSLLTTSSYPEIIFEEPHYEIADMISSVKKHIRQLEYNEQYILLAYYLYEKKLNEIASDLGISPENCRVIKHRTINRLIQLLPDEMGKKLKVRKTN